MKLSEKTKEILSNFSALNPGIVIKPGNMLMTTGGSDIFAKAFVDDTFPIECGIGNLRSLMGILGIMKEDYELEFGHNQLIIHAGKQTVKITYTSLDNIQAPKSDNLNVKYSDIEIDLPFKTINIIKTASVLSLPQLALIGEEGKISLVAMDKSNPTADNYSVELGETDKNFKLIFTANRIGTLLPRDYTVKISTIGVINLNHADISYWIACDPNASSTGNL